MEDHSDRDRLGEKGASFLETFEESRSSRIARLVVWIVIVAVAGLIVLRFNKPREHLKMNPEEVRRFSARFDSLCKTTLYPTVWRSGTFIRSRFEGDFEKWTLTISSRDWQLRDDPGRKDLVALIWTAYRAARQQAGGDPDDAYLIIEDENGRMLAEATPTAVTLHPHP